MRLLATRPLRGQLLAKLTCFAANLSRNKEWGEAITVPYGAVIMTDDTHSGK